MQRQHPPLLPFPPPTALQLLSMLSLLLLQVVDDVRRASGECAECVRAVCCVPVWEHPLSSALKNSAMYEQYVALFSASVSRACRRVLSSQPHLRCPLLPLRLLPGKQRGQSVILNFRQPLSLHSTRHKAHNRSHRAQNTQQTNHNTQNATKSTQHTAQLKT